MFQLGTLESRSEVVEIQEVAAEDMEVILKYIYGVLDALLKKGSTHSSLLTDRLQASLLDEAFDIPLREEFQQSLSKVLMCTYTGNNAWKPDVTLSLDGKRLPAHKFLLAEFSSVLEVMLQTKERKRVFEITDIDPEDMELILKYIYGTLDAIPEERVQSLLLATDLLQVKGLKRRCVTQLVINLSPQTFVQTSVLAEKLHHEDLIGACVDYALREENRSAIGKQEHLERLMQEAPAVALTLTQVSLEQGLPKKRQMPKQDGGEPKRLKKE